MKTKAFFRLLLISTTLTTTQNAAAFNPNEGTLSTPAYQPRPAINLPPRVVPQRYYVHVPATPVAPAPVLAPAPAPAITYAPAPVPAAEPAPEIRYTPAQQPIEAAAPTYTYQAQATPYYPPAPAAVPAPYYPPVQEPAPTYYAPAPQPVTYTPEPSQRSKPANRFTLGVEGYYDEYQEDVVDLTDTGIFGSLTGSYTHYFNDQWYGMLDLRYSRGSADYESTSGSIDDITQWETENRLLAGYEFPRIGNDKRLKTYFGLGQRYFSDELKGKSTGSGAQGYDRRIFQLYVPIGITYEFPAYGLTFTPNLEFDPVIYGNVSSRLGTLPGYTNIENEQTEGYGIRGEFLMGQTNERGNGWQFGPFVRYWKLPDSKVDAGFIEPENTRLQVGAKLNILF